MIELASDMGGGKTTFVKGLARGAGSRDTVASPSFTISKEYTTESFQIEHFDFYRLEDPGLIANELHEFLQEPQTVVVVEWADITRSVLPESRVTVTIQTKDENSRHLKFSYDSRFSYLFPEAS